MTPEGGEALCMRVHQSVAHLLKCATCTRDGGQDEMETTFRLLALRINGICIPWPRRSGDTQTKLATSPRYTPLCNYNCWIQTVLQLVRGIPKVVILPAKLPSGANYYGSLLPDQSFVNSLHLSSNYGTVNKGSTKRTHIPYLVLT